MRKTLVTFTVLLILLTACAPGEDLEVTTPETTIPRTTFRLTTPGPNPALNQPDADGQVAGVVQGLWHGIIAPVMLVASIFNPAVQIYEVHNTGTEYNLGYLFGVALIFLILGLLGGRRRR